MRNEMAKKQLDALRIYLNQMILGQSELVDGLLIALLADGHILVAIKRLAALIFCQALANSLR
jgi:MoxR-like ATPase